MRTRNMIEAEVVVWGAPDCVACSSLVQQQLRDARRRKRSDENASR